MKAYITIRVPQAMKEQLEQMAERERRSVSQVALMALERGIPSLEGAEPRRAVARDATPDAANWGDNDSKRGAHVTPASGTHPNTSAEMPTAPKPKKSKWANKYCLGHHVMGCEVCE